MSTQMAEAFGKLDLSKVVVPEKKVEGCGKEKRRRPNNNRKHGKADRNGNVKPAHNPQARKPKQKAQAQKPAPQPTEVASVAPAAPKKKKAVETITIPNGRELVVIFDLPRDRIPAGIQVNEAIGGRPAVKRSDEGVRRYHKARLDAGGLLTRCFVDEINVSGMDEKRCRVFMHCMIEASGPGLKKKWAGSSYEKLARSALSRIWKRIVFRPEDNGHSTVILVGSHKEVGTNILFAIE